MNRRPSWLIRSAGASVRTVMPEALNTRSISSLASGSSKDSSRGRASMTVTAAPKRAKTWASSAPVAPPPSTISDSGTCSAWTISRLVQYGAPARPSSGGMAGSVPVLITMPLRARNIRVPSAPVTVTWPAPVIFPCPRTRWPPLPINRSAATLSFQSSVASSRIRRATGDQSGLTVDVPAIPGTRLVSAIRLAARIIILEGTHP